MEEKAQLQQEVATVRAELKKVELFIKKEAELEQELADLKKQLVDDAKEASTTISDLERKHVQVRCTTWPCNNALRIPLTVAWSPKLCPDRGFSQAVS